MLIDGAKINIPFEKDIIVPRPEKDIVLRVAAVPYEKEFDTLCPRPEPPVTRDLQGTVVKRDYDDKKYRKQVEEWTERRFNFIVLKSIKNVDWETVIMSDKETWHNWRQECLDQGFTDPEVFRITQEVLGVHNPTKEMMDQMREDFLASNHRKVETANQYSQNIEKESI